MKARLTSAQERWLRCLAEGPGGIIDRYGHVVIAGEVVPQGAWPAWLRLVAYGLVAGEYGRLRPTELGLRVLENPLALAAGNS